MLELSTINPYIRLAKRALLLNKAEIKQRIIFDYELIYIEDGRVTLTYDGVEYVCEKGQFIFLRPGISHRFSNIHQLSQPHIHFDMTHTDNSPDVPVSFKDLAALTPQERSWIRHDIFQTCSHNPIVSFREKDAALQIFFDVIDLPESMMLTRKAKLIQLVDMLIRDNFPSVFERTDQHYAIEQHIKEYINAGQGLADSLEDLARQFGYSKYYLARRFKDSFGISLIAYRNEKRMQTAKELLKSNSVSAVTDMLGFSSIYVFSRAFKKHFGICPSEVSNQ